MRILARIFIVLFCLVFMANQAQSSTFADLGTIVGKLLVYTTKGMELLAERITVNGERLKAIENHLSKTSDFSVTSLQAGEWNRRIKAKEKEVLDASTDLTNLLK